MIGAQLLNYKITEKLGAGGQGTVYKAVDAKLGRTVVIKILSPELTAREVNLRRFEREAQLASALDHPNICTIYGLHEAGGVNFIAMQYIEGKNVRELVAGRPLELESALSIAAQVSDALTAAHARGIIHRDIKAGNVLVTRDGMAKVLDFGLAKLLDEQSGARSENIHLTEMGVPYGTATYAAPEQATGGHVDHRADIFSTGVLLYEMLCGTWPFRGKTSVEVRYAVLHDAPRSLNEMRPDMPPAMRARLQKILDRALAKRPEERYQKMAELRDDIRAALREVRQLKATASAAIDETIAPVAPRHQTEEDNGLGGKIRRFFRNITGGEIRATSTPPNAPVQSTQLASQAPAAREVHDSHITSADTSAPKSVAVLPFRNLSNDPEASFYEFSLADAVITDLARVRLLVVRPSSLIVKYQGQNRDPREIGEELKVNAVLAASFLRAGEKLRVNAQLLDVASGNLLWSDRIDATASDIIGVQDKIAQRIVDGLRIELSPDEKTRFEQRPTESITAYEEYLRGRDAMGRFIYHSLSNEDIETAIAHFRRAIELDPNFALAYCALGGCYANLVIKCIGDADDAARAEEYLMRGLALDPNIIEARMHRVFVDLTLGNKRRACEEIERLRREAPNDVGVQFTSAYIYRLDGEYEKSLRSLEKMLRLNPNERVIVSYNRARIFMYQGRYRDAMLELEQGRAIEPDHPLIQTFRAVCFYRQGEPQKAVELMREVLEKNPEIDGIRPHLAIALSLTGDHAAARAQLTDRVKKVATADHDAPYWLATAYAVEGMRDEAFHWFETAIRLGNENRPWFESNPLWDDLRDDPRFIELINRIKKSQAPSPKSQA
jgi:serine/threonine protein kinase/tetratricopeptide (TPR) repeat protein